LRAAYFRFPPPSLTTPAASWPRQFSGEFSQAAVVLDALTEAVYFDLW
jgi:hypothetical protein